MRNEVMRLTKGDLTKFSKKYRGIKIANNFNVSYNKFKSSVIEMNESIKRFSIASKKMAGEK